MQTVRPAAVAGMFYPEARAALGSTVRTHLAKAAPSAGDKAELPKALIAPHAGYVYSGPVAASAYARIAAGREIIRRVVLLGPAHRVPIRGLALPVAQAFATPLGNVEIDAAAASDAHALAQVRTSEAAHALEHALEVQLPFLQLLLEEFRIVPFVVGDATAAEVAAVIDRLWGGPETLIVVSSDLSHYHPHAEARALDQRTSKDILALASSLDHEQACGATPINGFALCARRRGLTAELLDLRNSGDTAGDKSRVVGYAAFALTEPAADRLRGAAEATAQVAEETTA